VEIAGRRRRGADEGCGHGRRLSRGTRARARASAPRVARDVDMRPD
jgi:hypothetical protein